MGCRCFASASPASRGGLPAYDARSDGEQFVVNMLTANTDAPVTLVQNWVTTFGPK